MVKELKKEYDYIFLDSPPCLGMADAIELAKVADAVIMVVEAEKTKIHHLNRTMEQFESLREKVIGAILNKANFKKNNEYNYGYYYEAESTKSQDSS